MDRDWDTRKLTATTEGDLRVTALRSRQGFTPSRLLAVTDADDDVLVCRALRHAWAHCHATESEARPQHVLTLWFFCPRCETVAWRLFNRRTFELGQLHYSYVPGYLAAKGVDMSARTCTNELLDRAVIVIDPLPERTAHV